MSIRVEGVTKLYGTQRALDNVSFSIDTGQIVGFIGPNGAGKTTMMRIITGFLKPTEGRVLVNDIDTQANSLEVRRMIGYLPENNPLYYDMFVREFLHFIAGLYGLDNRRQLVNRVIEMTGLGPEQHKKIRQLSKGYKQRVGLAQAIIHDPQVLILDEPTSGLDPNQIIQIRELISTLGKEKTVMLSTHIMQEVEAICDRIIIINQGRIVADDRPDTIHQRVREDEMTFVVEFDTEVKEDLLLTIPEVDSVKSIGQGRWLITSRQDIRRLIFDFAVKQGIAVLSMDMKKKSLEQVFHDLTQSEKNKDE